MGRASGRVFEFGSFRLDTKQGVLLRDGRRVNLIPKAVALLAELVVEAGSVVTKDELLQRVWSDSFVQEGNLSKLVFLLRQELARGSGAGTIETISKRGYVFSGHVHEIAQAPSDTAEPLRTIAVLPFATAAGAPGHLGEGVADEVLVTLTRVRALSVMARTSSFRFSGTDVGVIAVGRRLQVAWLVEGSVRTDGDRIRVTAALVETATAVRRWSDTFDGSGSDLLRISEAIASGIAAVLVGGNPAAAPADPVWTPRAYRLVLAGSIPLEPSSRARGERRA